MSSLKVIESVVNGFVADKDPKGAIDFLSELKKTFPDLKVFSSTVVSVCVG